ncbi:hypothetical protein NXS19_012996 [Fusarium pseudograminearum]|nr:hypothetical protein NXS19_012996 [Fusarium pseudograminearum]
MAPLFPSVTLVRNENPLSETERQQRLESPELGISDTDHMAIARYADGQWQSASVQPFFSPDSTPWIKMLPVRTNTVRGPDKNAKRLNVSADRIAMPELPEKLFLDMVKALVWVERDWFPSGEGGRLYLRPFMFAAGNSVRFAVAKEYIFCVLVSPSRSFFSRTVLNVYVEPNLRRASPGGTGSSKCGGNYAAALRSHQEAAKHGCDQALFLEDDGKIQEMEVTNIFFVMKNGTIRTPCLNDTILNGVTRDSVMQLAKRRGIKVEERDYYFKTFYADTMSGDVLEVFACGTAGGLIAVGSFYCPFTDDAKTINGTTSGRFLIGDGEMGDLTKKLRLDLLGIQNGTRDDPFGWLHEIRGEDLPQSC